MKSTITLFLVFFAINFSIGQNDISNYSFTITPSFEHISVHVDFEGDDNRNSDFDLTFRKTTDTNLRDGAPSSRASNDMVVDGSALNRNFHAASAMFLEPATEYELNISITDADGGSIEETRIVSTKRIPNPSFVGIIRHVAPGNGGGEGSVMNPYLGLQEAADNAIPGDVFIVKDGTYASFELQTSGTTYDPIVFLSSSLHGAIIDGENTDRGIITLGVFNDSIQHIIIDGFKIENGNWGIDAQNTQYVTVRNNKFSNVRFGYYNRRENGWEHNQYITNNELIGIIQWPGSGIPSERGIDLRGNNNTVSYNYIENFGDGVSTDGQPYGSSFGMDIHNNDLYRIVDDCVEVDGIVSNARIYSNRGFNGRMGASLAPVLGGPAYIFRNVFFNMELSTFKMNRGPSGLIMAHNTGLKTQNASSSDSGWQNTFSANNILCGSRYCFEEYGLVEGSQDDWDYNAYYSSREVGVEPWFKWDNIRYDNIEELYSGTGIEENGIQIDLNTFVNVILPDIFTTEYNSEDIDLNLDPNSPCINSGVQIANLNDPFVTDGMPDRGAIEFGTEATVYGPTFEVISSIDNKSIFPELKIYPNPVVQLLEIKTDLENARFQVMDLQGKILIESKDMQIDVSILPQGLYQLIAINENNNVLTSLKFVKR